MENFIRLLPQELEDKILGYVLCNSVKIKLLSWKYSNDLFDGLTLKQIDAVYKNACIYKIHAPVSSGYKIHPSVRSGYFHSIPLVPFRKLFQTYGEEDSFMTGLKPPNETIILHWKGGNTYSYRSISMYVDSIFRFGKFLRTFPHKNKNNLLRDYCDKVIYQMIMCILIIKQKNLTCI
jgi:hypothetical protein